MPTKNKDLKYFKSKQGRFDGYNELVNRIVVSLRENLTSRDAILKEAAEEHEAVRKKEASLASNTEVFDTVIDLAGGDDQDGGHSPDASITIAVYSDELIKRLKDVGFLPEGYKPSE